MANVYAVKSGNWSDQTTWNTGALPTSADDVYANNFTVTVDVNATVLSIRNTSASGIVAGGGYSITNSSNGITLTTTTGGFVVGPATLLSCSIASPNAASLSGPFSANANISTLTHSGSGAVNITTTTYTGSVNAGAITNASSGTINFVGNVTGGSSSGPAALLNSSTGTVNVTGNCTGANYSAVANTSSGSINITGSVTATGGDFGVKNTSNGTLTVTGSCTGGSSTGAALSNSGTGSLYHYGTATASATASAISSGSSGQFTYLTGPFIGTVQGVVANNAFRWRWVASVGSSYMTVPNSTATGYKNLYTADSTDSASGQPAATNVRSGTIYGPSNELTGTCAVPGAGSVALGVPVGSATGTAILTQQNVADALSSASAVTLNQQTSSLTTPGSIGERLKLASTVATTAQQLSDALSNE